MAGARGSTVAVLALPGDGSVDPFLISPIDYHRRCLDLLSHTLDQVIQFCGGYNCGSSSEKRKDCYYVINYVRTECSLYSRVFKVDYAELSEWCDYFLKYVHGPIGDDVASSSAYSEDDCLELLRKVTLFLEHMLQALGPTNLRKVIAATIFNVNSMAESVQDLKVYTERRKFNLDSYGQKSSTYLQQVIDVLDKNQEDKQVKQLLLEVVGPRLNFSVDETADDAVDTSLPKVKSPEAEPKMRTVQAKSAEWELTRSFSQISTFRSEITKSHSQVFPRPELSRSELTRSNSLRPEIRLKPTKIPFLKEPTSTPPLSPRMTPSPKPRLTPAHMKASLLHASEERIKPVIVKSKAEGQTASGSKTPSSHSRVKASLQQWNAIIEQSSATQVTPKLQPKPNMQDRLLPPNEGAKTWPRLKSTSFSEKPAIKPKPQLNCRSASQPVIKPLLKPKPKHFDTVSKQTLLTGMKSKPDIRSTSTSSLNTSSVKPEVKPKPRRIFSTSSDSQPATDAKPDDINNKSQNVMSPKSPFIDNDTQPRLAYQYFNLNI